MTASLRTPRRIALTAITVLVSAASAASFAESYRGLFLWALQHGLWCIWAAGFPLQVDVFIAVGELALFVALADQWCAHSRAAAWTVTTLTMNAMAARRGWRHVPAKAAGLPVVKLHEGRHSAASLVRDADVDPEIRRKTLGQADQAMTSHYMHIEAQAHRAAAEPVARLVGREP